MAKLERVATLQSDSKKRKHPRPLEIEHGGNKVTVV